MKSTFLRNCLVLGAVAAFTFITGSARAEDPQPKRQTQSAKHSDDNVSSPKSSRKKPVPSVDGRQSTTTSAKSDLVGGANGRETEVPTGSHLPKTYQRKGYTTNNDPTTFTYDRNDIRLRNSNTVSESLRQVPGVTVGGRR